MDFIKSLATRIEQLMTHEKGANLLFKLGEEIARLDAEKEKLYARLGCIVYKSQNEAQIDSLMQQIECIEQIIAQKNVQLEQIRRNNASE